MSTCSSLLAVVNVDGSPVIQFAHFSVKEYLTSARLPKSKDNISRFHIPMTMAHTIVAQACLGVLLHLDKRVSEVGLANFPLAEYAAKHWMDHARFENVLSHVQDGMKRLFDPRKHHLSAWVSISDPYVESRPSVALETAKPTPLHYAASIGMHDVAAFLIDEHLQDVNARRYRRETPLHAASREGHAVVAQLLLENGADVMAKSELVRTPLHLASMYGHAEVARILLKHGAKVDTKDLCISSPPPSPLFPSPPPSPPPSPWSPPPSLPPSPPPSPPPRSRSPRPYMIPPPSTRPPSPPPSTQPPRPPLRRLDDAIIVVKSTPLGLALDAGHDDVVGVLLEYGADRSISKDHKWIAKAHHPIDRFST